uniref:Uncharacterized protein n=1 Tax=Cucumis melo TaxID=3656 RepID=A0A9I9EC20_CUCME
MGHQKEKPPLTNQLLHPIFLLSLSLSLSQAETRPLSPSYSPFLKITFPLYFLVLYSNRPMMGRPFEQRK